MNLSFHQMADPMSQFEVKKLFELQIGGIDLSFTNAAFYMLLGVSPKWVFGSDQHFS